MFKKTMQLEVAQRRQIRPKRRYDMRLIRQLHRQRGVSLLEVLISVLVLGVGLLGVAALQTSSMRNTNSALERTMAVILTDTFAEIMRNNQADAELGNLAFADCAGNAAFQTDLWVDNVKKATREDVCPVVSWDGTRYTITIAWADERMLAGNEIVTQVMP